MNGLQRTNFFSRMETPILIRNRDDILDNVDLGFKKFVSSKEYKLFFKFWNGLEID